MNNPIRLLGAIHALTRNQVESTTRGSKEAKRQWFEPTNRERSDLLNRRIRERKKQSSELFLK